MLKVYLFIVLCLSLVLILFSCSTSTIEPVSSNLGYTYFPLEEGRFAIYSIEETNYAITADPVIRTYQVKEVVAERFTDLSNEEAFQVKRFSRQNEAEEWVLDSIWVAKRTVHQAVRIENNVPFVKLVFPLKENLMWNGNALNTRDTVEYEASKVSQPYKVAEQEFSKSATITHVNDSSACKLNRIFEVYADSVGLVYTEKILVNYRQVNNTCQGNGDIQDGVEYFQRLIHYGKE